MEQFAMFDMNKTKPTYEELFWTFKLRTYVKRNCLK